VTDNRKKVLDEIVEKPADFFKMVLEEEGYDCKVISTTRMVFQFDADTKIEMASTRMSSADYIKWKLDS